MGTRAALNDFLAQRSLAVVGVSRSGKKYSNLAHRQRKAEGCSLVVVHSEAQAIAARAVGARCPRR